MKRRTIEELHDKHTDHRKFATVCDILTEKGYQINDIREFYEKFKFSINTVELEYSKQWKISAAKIADYIIKTYEMNIYVHNS